MGCEKSQPIFKSNGSGSMTKKISNIIKKCGINDFAFTSFDEKVELLPCRASVRIPQNPRTVIMLALPYFTKSYPNRNISYYAIVDDYHSVAKCYLDKICDKLKDEYCDNHFEHFCDNSPIKEVYYAAKAGLGVIGQNGLLITEKYGSFVFLASIVTDLELHNYSDNEIKGCIGCGRCQKACPGGCIECGNIKKEDCASEISQKKGELDKSQVEKVKKTGLVWGCDICQTECPLNDFSKISPTYILEFSQNIITNVSETDASALCKTRAFGFRGDKVILRNLKY